VLSSTGGFFVWFMNAELFSLFIVALLFGTENYQAKEFNMAKDEWESGSVIIPRQQWPQFRKSIVEKYNELLLEVFEEAEKWYELAKKAGCRKQDFNYSAWLYNNMKLTPNIVAAEAEHKVKRLIVSVDANGKTVLHRPKKKDLGLLPVSRSPNRWLRVNSDARLALRDKETVFSWNVQENNHAVEGAWRTPMAQHLCALLDGIKWTRDTGGKFVGNDEYNQDCDYPGGGANYVTRRWGPRGV